MERIHIAIAAVVIIGLLGGFTYFQYFYDPQVNSTVEVAFPLMTAYSQVVVTVCEYNSQGACNQIESDQPVMNSQFELNQTALPRVQPMIVLRLPEGQSYTVEFYGNMNSGQYVGRLDNICTTLEFQTNAALVSVSCHG
jgi:hypothetical protein